MIVALAESVRTIQGRSPRLFLAGKGGRLLGRTGQTRRVRLDANTSSFLPQGV